MSTSDRDPELHRLMEDAVSGVRPHEGPADIRARAGARPGGA